MNNDTVSVDRSEFGTFIHSELDDAKLTPYAFRIYCHLARRANLQGKAWPGAISMSKVTLISERQVRYAIAELETRGMITVVRSTGGRASNHYYLNSKKNWTPVDDSGKDPCTTCTPAQDAGQPCTTCTPPLQEMQGTPAPPATEGNPIRGSTEGNPLQESSECLLLEIQGGKTAEQVATEQAEALYEAYPRKIGRKDALKKIRTALKKATFDTLLKGVESYAAAKRGTEPDFIAYPATWFHQERWNDKPETTTSRHDSKHASKGLW